MSDTQTTALTTRTTSTGHTLTIDLDRMHLTIDGPTETMDAIPDAEIHSLCADAGVQWLGEVVDETTYAVRPNLAVFSLLYPDSGATDSRTLADLADIRLQGDPRGRVLLLRLPGEQEASTV